MEEEQRLIEQRLITPKEIFEQAVEKDRERKRNINELIVRADEAYKRFLWNFLEVEEVGI